ncbi:M15 family metallopeptidase [Garicola koreensis]|uniref:D-alanyl-D-alanine carboxypeptidase n=1 Tax=Garicola koreensis TaxID=1262554 RepID=A0A7W5Y1F8_9MICC|nr:M15 family metallopeptidase [Garicola koreensis]MBB3668123.1 D-alanyl-D-alanine carboxypeptidase [Garicola koreensis]
MPTEQDTLESEAPSTIPGPTLTSEPEPSPSPTASTETASDETAPDATPSLEHEPEETETQEAETQEAEPQRASDPSWDPDSIHVLANRQNPLDPIDYAPSDLVYPEVPFYGPESAMQVRQEAAAALEQLLAAGDAQGMHLGLVSAYRSFDYQQQIYSQRHAEVGTEATDLYMSRPGYSEHQTGLAADVISIANPDCMLGECFAATPEGQWVAENAHKHGFVIRYPQGKEHITGYPYEPWHLRYVGVETAQEVYQGGHTLEKYWDQPPAPDYDEPEPNPELLN